MPTGGLVLGDMLLAQKIALETMEQEALGVANSQPCLDARPVASAARKATTKPVPTITCIAVVCVKAEDEGRQHHPQACGERDPLLLLSKTNSAASDTAAITAPPSHSSAPAAPAAP
jgi:hypothetical protein